MLSIAQLNFEGVLKKLTTAINLEIISNMTQPDFAPSEHEHPVLHTLAIAAGTLALLSVAKALPGVVDRLSDALNTDILNLNP